MNWDAISFDWNQVRAFLASAEEGSFSGAARALKTTQPTIGRQVSELEARLGVTLFERSVRGPKLTEAGRGLLDHVIAMGEAATLISMAAVNQSQDVSGEVVVTATDLLSAAILPAILKPLRESAPGLLVRIVASSDIQNLTHREADIAIRHMRPEQPDLIAKHVGDFGANLYGATSYLEQQGRPRTPRDVAKLAFVGNADPDRLIAPLAAQGIPLRRENFVASTDSGVVAWELLKAGFGVAMQPDVLGNSEPGVEKVLPDMASVHFPIWLVTHRELQTSRRIRLVFDRISQGLRDAGVRVGGPRD